MISIKHKPCAVLFIDLLGMGALTTGKIQIPDKCYEAWGIIEKSTQMLAARILVQFRDNLDAIRHNFPEVNIAQLSDGAFIWSSDIKKLLFACHDLMQINARTGIFCRGGMSYGDVITTEDPIPFGQFILGDAVTRAVSLESMGKGARIFLDSNLHNEITLLFPEVFKLNTNEIMVEIVNHFNGDYCYELRWYATHDLSINLKQSNVEEYYADFHKNLCTLLVYNLNQNRFIWNFDTQHHRYTNELLHSLAFQFAIMLNINDPLPRA